MRVAAQSAVLAAILLVTTGSSLLGSAAGVQPATIPTQFIIELTEKPAAQKISVEGQRVATSGQRVSGSASASAAAAAEHVAFRAASAHIPFKTDHVYIHVKGITQIRTYYKSVPHSRRSLQKAPLKNMATVTPPETAVVHNGNATGALKVNTLLGFTGKGMRVGIIDTGVDYMHPDLGGGFGPGYKVAYGYDFMGDAGGAIDAFGTINYYPDNDPRDQCDGHGSHVAGIVGAKGNVVGQAPDVTLGLPCPPGDRRYYVLTGAIIIIETGNAKSQVQQQKVFGCNSGAPNAAIIAAAEMAFVDGMDVINLCAPADSHIHAQSFATSLNGGPTFPLDGPDAVLNVALNNLDIAGMVVTVAMGNAGRSTTHGGIGLFAAESPANAPNVMSVASAYDDSYAVQQLLANPGSRKMTTFSSFSAKAGIPLVVTPSFIDYTFTNGKVDVSSFPSSDACNGSAIDPAIIGKIALVRRGTCRFTEKAINVLTAGATGILIYNNNLIDQTLRRIVIPTDSSVVVACISNKNGQFFINGHHSGANVTITVNNNLPTRVPAPLAGSTASYTSWGPDIDLTFKPTIAAPGSVIDSTWPLALGAYIAIEGTSMATPMVAGCVALYLQAHPGTPQADVLVALQNTATPIVDTLEASIAVADVKRPAPIHIQGAGKINLYAALKAKARITPSTLPLGAKNGGKRTLTITNTASAAVTYTITYQPAMSHIFKDDLTGQVEVVADATVALSAKTVKVAKKGKATFTVTITPPKSLSDLGLYGGFVVISGGNQTYRVPFMGLKGDYTKMNVLGSISYGSTNKLQEFTALGSQNQIGKTVGSFADATFDFSTASPVVSFVLNQPARRLVVAVVNLDTKISYPMFDKEYIIEPTDGNGVNYPLSVTITDVVVNAAKVPAGYVPKMPLDVNFSCTLADGNYQVVTKAYTYRGNDAKFDLYNGPETHFRVAHNSSVALLAPYCTKAPVRAPKRG